MPQFLATRAVQWVTEHNVVKGKKGKKKILFGIFGKSFSCLVQPFSSIKKMRIQRTLSDTKIN